MAQAGCFVAAEAMDVPILDAVFANVGRTKESAQDEVSSFSRESSRLGRALSRATSRTLLLADEFGCGTNPSDGAALFASLVVFLSKLAPERRPLALLVTHFNTAIDRAAEALGPQQFSRTVVPLKMQYIQEQRSRSSSGAVFLFRVAEGIGRDSLCFECARIAGVPEEVVRRAEEVSHLLKIGDCVCPLGANKKKQDEEEFLAVARAFLSLDLSNEADLDSFLKRLVGFE